MAVGGVALSFLLALVMSLSGVLAPGGGSALGASTTLTIIGGDVLVSRAGGAFSAASDGQVLEPGDAIRTGSGSRAVLTYFEGSTVSIEPDSELAIDQARTEADGSTVVLMSQNLGRTWHLVTKLIAGGSRYEVRTPAATASVRGTAFEVGVIRNASGETVTSVSTTEGVVAAAAPATASEPEPEPVVIAAGFRTTASSNERKPQTPTLAPEPARRTTVNVASDNTLVVDSLGRANGVKDGRLVVQTPGAQVQRVDGRVVVTMPDLPDGKVATVVRKRSRASENERVDVVTTVEDKGKPAATITETVEPADEEIVTGVDVKAAPAGSEATPELRRLDEQEKKDLPAPKAVDERDDDETAALRPGLGALPLPAALVPIAQREDDDEDEDGGNAGNDDDDDEDGDERRSEDRSASNPGFVPPLSFQGAPSAARREQDEESRREERRVDEKEIRDTDQLRRAAQEAARLADELRARAEQDQRRANEERARAEERERAAEGEREQAELEREAAQRKADLEADAARKNAAQAEARAREQAAKRAEAAQEAAKRQGQAAREAANARQRDAKQAERAREAAKELERALEVKLDDLNDSDDADDQRADDEGDDDED